MTIHAATAGHYNAVYGGQPLGRTDEGWFWEVSQKGNVVQFEEYSDNIVDMVYRGAEVFVETVLKEWKAAGLYAALWPWVTAPAVGTFGVVDCTGQFAVNNGFAQELALTASTCSPAGTDNATITFPNAIIAPEVSSRINLDNNVRMIPIRFQVFLTEISANEEYRFFSIS